MVKEGTIGSCLQMNIECTSESIYICHVSGVMLVGEPSFDGLADDCYY